MNQQKYLAILQQSKDSILHNIKQLNQTLKFNQQQNISQSLANVLSSIATFDEDFIHNSMGSYSTNPLLQESLDKIITKIKSTKESQKLVSNNPPLNKIQQEPPTSTLRVSSQIIRSSSKEKEASLKPDVNHNKKDGSSGLFGVFGKILGGGSKAQKAKVHQMILPQKESKAVYDPVKKKWIFEGEEQEPQKQIPKPPPKKQLKLQQSQTSSQQTTSKQLKKSVSQIDEMTAPPSFKRRGQTKSTGGTKKIMIKEEIIPTTLVEEELNSLDLLMNMIDKEFCKLQENFQELENGWRKEIEKQAKGKHVENERKVKQIISAGREKVEQQLNQGQRAYIQELNQKIKEFNETSVSLMEGYSNVRVESLSVGEFDRDLNQKLMRIATQNTIIAHQLSGQGKNPQLELLTHANPHGDQKPIKNFTQIRKLLEEINLLKSNNESTIRQLKQKQQTLNQAQQTITEINNQKLTLQQSILTFEQFTTQNQAKNDKIMQLQEKIRNILESGSQTHLRQARQAHEIEQIVRTSVLFKQVQMTVLTQSDTIRTLTTKCNQLQAKHSKLKEKAAKINENQIEIRNLNEIISFKDAQISEIKLKLENSHMAARILEEEKIEEEQNAASSQKKIVYLMDILELQKKSKQELILSNQFLQSQLEKIKFFNQQLTEQNQQLHLKNKQFQTSADNIKLQLSKLQEDKKFFQLSVRQHQLVQQETLKTNLQQLESFAHSIAEESLLLVTIQAKQLQLRAHSDRSSQNSSKKSENSENQESHLNENQQPKVGSFLNISDILTEMSKQYIQKVSEMKYQLNEFQQNTKSLSKSFTRQKQKLINQIDSLKKSLNTSLALNEGYKKTRKELQEKVSNLEIEGEKTKKKLQLMKKEQLANKELIEQTLYQKHNHSHQLLNLTHNIQTLQNQVQQLEEQIETKNQELWEMSAEIDEMRNQLQEKENTVTQKENVIARLKAALQEEKEDLAQLAEKKQAQQRVQLREKERELQSVRKQLSQLVEKEQKLIKEYKSSKQVLSVKLQQSESSNKQLSKQLKWVNSQLSQLQQSLPELNSQIQRLNQINSQLSSHISSLESRNSQLQNQLQLLRKQFEADNNLKDHQIHSLITQIKQSQQQQSQLQQRVAQYVDYSNSLKHDLDSVYLHKQSLENRVTELQQREQQNINKLSALSQQQLEKINDQKQQLQLALQTTINMYRQVQKEFYEMKQNMDHKIHYLTQELHNSYQSGQTLSRQLSSYSDLVSKMADKMAQLQVQVRQNQTNLNTEDLQLKYKQIEQKHQEQISQLLLSFQEKEKQLQRKEQQLDQNNHQLAIKNGKINALSQQNVKQSQQLLLLTDELVSVKKNLNQSLHHKSYDQKIHQQHQLLTNQYQQLNSQYQQLNSNYAQIYKMYEDLQRISLTNQQSFNHIKSGLLQLCQQNFTHISHKYYHTLVLNSQSQTQTYEYSSQLSSTVVSILTEISQKYQELAQQKDQSSSELLQLIEQLEQCCLTEQHLQSAIKQLTVQLETQKTSHQSLYEQHQGLLKSHQQLQQSNEQLQRAQSQLLQMVQKENQIKTQEINQLQKQLQIYKSKHTQDKNETMTKSQFIELANKYQKLCNQLEQNKHQLIDFQQTKQQKQLLEDQNYQLKQEKSIQLRKQSSEPNPNHLNSLSNRSQNKLTPIDFDQSGQLQQNNNLKQSQQLNQILIELSTRLQAAENDKSSLTSQLEECDKLLKQQKMITNALKQRLSENQLSLETLSNTNKKIQSLINQKNQTIAVKDSIISELSSSLQAKQDQIRKMTEDKMFSSRDSHVQSGMEGSYYRTLNRDSLKDNQDNMYATANSKQPRSGSLKANEDNQTQIEELLDSMNSELQQRKIKETEFLEIITQQQTQISILKEKCRQLELIPLQSTKSQQPPRLIQGKPKSQQQQVNDSEELYMVIEEMQKEIQEKNQQLQRLKLIVDSLDSSVSDTGPAVTIKNSPETIRNQQQSSEEQIFSQVSDNLSKLAEQLSNKEDQLKTQEQEVREMRELLKERDNEIENQKMYAEILRDKEEQQEAQILHLNSVNHQLQQQIESLNSNINELSIANQNYSGQIRNLNSQLQAKSINPSVESLIKGHQQEEDHRVKIEELETLLANMQEEINAKDEELLDKSNSIHKLKQIQVQSDNRISKLTQQLQKLTENINQLQETLLSTNSQIASLRDNQVQLQQDLNQKQQLINTQQQQISSLSQELEAIREKSKDPSQQAILPSNRQLEDMRHLKQNIIKLEGQISKQKEDLDNKDDEIEEMTQLINSQATDIEKLQQKIISLDQQLLQAQTNYQQQLNQYQKQLSKSEQQLSKSQQELNQPTHQIQSSHKLNEQNDKPQKKENTNDQLALVKVQLEEVYQQLRNKKIQVDQLRKNIFDVNKMFTQRQTRYESKIKSLETQLHKYSKTKDTFNKYETSIKQLQAEISNLSSEKAEFLRVIQNLEKQLLSKDKHSNFQKTQDPKLPLQANNYTNSAKTIPQKKEPASENKLRSTRSEVIEPLVEVKPTGFFGSISSLFMSPIETERMAKKIVNK